MFGALEWIPYEPHSPAQITCDEDPPSITPLPIPSVPKKKLLWQLEYKSVPYYIRTFADRLFVCDKYGTVRSKGD